MNELNYTGYIEADLNDESLAELIEKGTSKILSTTTENQYVIAHDEHGKEVYFKCKNGKYELVKYPFINSILTGQLKPRNPQQYCAMDMLLDESIPVKLITGKFGSGKAQPVDTLIPTPEGNKRLGDIQVGDYVFDRFGNPTKVLGVYPQGTIDCYKISFNDDRIAFCNNEHIWSCFTSKGNLINKTVQQMIDSGLKTSSGQFRYKIPLNNAVKYVEKKYDIDPYVMGCFLGDGCCLESALTISSADEEMVAEIAKLINAKSYFRSHKDNFSWCFYFKDEDRYKYSLNPHDGHSCRITTKAFFKHYPQLMDYAKNKSIPKEYLFGSIDQRFSLLQGLLDTDGTIEPDKGRIRFTTTSKQLKDDVKQLVWSLGYLCTESIDNRTEGAHKNICYNLSISAPVEDKPYLFRLSRKRQIAIDNMQKRKCTHSTSLTIRNIEKLPEQEEMVCLYVDNKEHLFLTNDYLVTHNTLACIDFAIQAIETGKFEKIVFVRNNVQVANTDSLGALPGDELEKTLPYVMPFADHCGGKDGLMRLIHDERLEVIPLAFLRGRSIRNAIIYSMESENLTKEQIQLIMGRVDEGSILVMDGDIKQRDKAAFEKSMGLERMVSALKGNKLFGYIHLVKSERSEVSALADLLDE